MLRVVKTRHLKPVAARSASYILGMETSCDDTAAAVLDQDGRVLSSVISSQWELNAKWRGIVPSLAARAHAENLPHVINAAIEQSGLESVQQVSVVAVTSGPGLAPCLNVGLQSARQICLDNRDIAFLPINHLEAHLLVSRLPQLNAPRAEFPFIVLLVSGGHCCLVLAKGLGDYELLGNTLDDSIGEAFDKVARMLDLTASNDEKHGGKLIEDMAARGDSRAFSFTEPMKHRKILGLQFFLLWHEDCNASRDKKRGAAPSFYLKRFLVTNGCNLPQLNGLNAKTKEDLCASFQRRAVDQLITRVRRACRWSKARLRDNCTSVVVCGGVASNQYLRDRMQEAAEKEGVVAIFPPAKYCTDNGVMVAWAGLEWYVNGVRSDPEHVRYQPRWPLETLQPLASPQVTATRVL